MKFIKISLLIFVVFLVVSNVNSGIPFKTEELYKEIFKIKIIKYGDKVFIKYDINKTDSTNILHQYLKNNFYYLDYLVTNCVPFDNKKLKSLSQDTLKLNSLFYSQLKSSTKFNQAFLPSIFKYLSEKGIKIQNYQSPPKDEAITIDELMKIGVRFFFPNRIKDNKIKAHICIVINGMKDYPNRNCALEAFVFSAIFNNVVLDDKFGVYKKYKEILNKLPKLQLSKDNNVAIQRAQGAMWYELYKYEPLKKVFVYEYNRIGKWMNFKLSN